MMAITLKEIPVGGQFRLSPTGILYEKVNEQGMENMCATIRNVVRKPSRKCHKGFKEIVKFQTIKVYPI